MSDVSRIFDLLVYGSRADRDLAQADFDKLTEPERARLRVLIIDALKREFYPGREHEEENRKLVWTRSWLLSSLGRIGGADTETEQILRKHLDSGYERDEWVRYWVLEGLFVAGVSYLEELAQEIKENDREEPLVRMLAVAILASKGDKESREEILTELAEDTYARQKAALRALRVVYIPAAVKPLCKIVDAFENIWYIYDILHALNLVPGESEHAGEVQQVIGNFIPKSRDSGSWDGVRTKAIKVLGNLRAENMAPVLVQELTDDNPAIVREAAQALEKILGIRTATVRVVEAASKVGGDRIGGFANALRWMDRDSVVEELETIMVSGQTDQQEIARTLLSEIGGVAAFQKLRARTEAMSQYTRVLEQAESKIRDLFESSIREAHIGFNLATAMDGIVFILGIGLLAVSAGLVLYNSGTLESWAGVGLTGGTGVLGIVYGVLIAKPRKQVREAVDHLMYIKVIFLGYLRQLHQADQAYTRRLLEDEPLMPKEVEEFSEMVRETMLTVIRQLAFSNYTESAKEAQKSRLSASISPKTTSDTDPGTENSEE